MGDIQLYLGENNIDTHLNFSGLKVKINPMTVDDMSQFLQTAQLYYLRRDLKQYRPQRKPITDD